jgi:hypothetical protein
MGTIEKQTGEYLKGDFVKDRDIRELQIVSTPMDVESQFGTKLQCDVTFAGQTKEDPFKWTLNKKSRNILVEYFGTNDADWVNKTVPIESAPTEKGRAIYVDEAKLKKFMQAAASTQTEIL